MKITQEQLQKIESDISALFTGAFYVSELFSVLEDAVATVATIHGINADEAIIESKSVWDYLNTKYQIIDKLDSLVKLPVYLEPFDSMIISMAINSVLIPLAIKSLWKL